MLTVIVCLVGSGKRSTRRPLPRRYSVIPSTEVTRAGGASALVSGGVAAAATEAAKAARMSEGKVFLNDFIRFLFLEKPLSRVGSGHRRNAGRSGKILFYPVRE